MGRKKIATFAVMTCLLTSGFWSVNSMQLENNQASYIAEAAVKKQFKLSDKQYKRVKGLWTYNSSGGWNVKFTRSKVKYYNRDNGKLEWTAKIKKCKKAGKTYIYYIQSQNGKYQFRTSDENADVLEYYGTWDNDCYSDYYSGSSSMERVANGVIPDNTKKIRVYGVLGNQIKSFKVSNKTLHLQSKSDVDYWNYGDGYNYFNTKKVSKKRIKFKMSQHCKWTYSFAGDADGVIRTSTNYNDISQMIRSAITDDSDMGTIQVRIFVKNKRVIRVDIQTE